MRATDWIGIVALCLVPVAFLVTLALCHWYWPPQGTEGTGPVEWSDEEEAS